MIQQAVEQKEILNNTNSHIYPQSSLNDSYAFPSSTIQHTYSSLDRVEASLGRARAEIGKVKNENHTDDPDYVPIGPMYWNAAAFHRYQLPRSSHSFIFYYCTIQYAT